MEITVPPKPDIVGLGFRPTEEELVDHYLKHRLLQDDPDVHVIPDIDLCDVEPWHVPVMLAKSAIQFNDPEWFFFSPVGYKYSNSKRFNRTTKCGFWKTTGKDRSIRTWDTNTVVGTKKTLVFYEGRVPHGAKSSWVIHEYHADTFPENQRTFVLCRLRKRPEYENQTTAAEIPSEGTFTEIGTFQAVNQTEKYFSSIYQSPTGIEQDGASFANFPIHNAYFRNENNIMQTSLETTIENDELINSLLAGDRLVIDEEPIVIDEERKHAFVNSLTQSKSLERGADALLCDEGELSRSMVSEYENQTTAAGIPSEGTFTEIGTTFQAYRSPTGIEQEEASFANFPIYNAYLRDENNIMQSPLETTIENDELINSLLAGERLVIDEEPIVIDEERMHAFVNSLTQSKSLERGADALLCDEGELSRSMVSEYENQTTAVGIPSEGTFTEIGTTFQEYRSSTGIEQEEASFANFPIYNAYLRNENNIMQTPLENTTENDKFINSLLAEDRIVIDEEQIVIDDDECIVIDDEERLVIDEEPTHAFVNSFTQSKSLKRAYCESSDTDSEVVVSKPDGDIVDTSTMCNKYLSSDEYHISKWFKSSDIVDTSTMCNKYPSSDEYHISKWFKSSDIVDTSTMCNKYPSSDKYHTSKWFKSSHDVYGGEPSEYVSR